MPYCTKCGFQAADDDSFCARCGAEIKKTSEMMQKNNSSNNININNINNKKSDVDWNKSSSSSFWKVFWESLKHTFSDTEGPISKKRLIVNSVLGILILAIVISIFLPDLKMTFGTVNPYDSNGDCRYVISARKVEMLSAVYFNSTNKFNVLIKNFRNDDLLLKSISKTYEFQDDFGGETEIEVVNAHISPDTILNLTFFVDKEPYLLGFSFAGCEKIKLLEWSLSD
ncbi:MAG: zinc-ribbon domain-containing protein [Nanoarchaeota archaeon]|nr:zinc-ribbon domain-containing protein [Nanoarchaeota archaeon]MBU1031164.1 zinc-ribbon domain-containing protein [Nanoarchaeota archaeon]MBU1849111.1 zinc-ribbon domain-containing protein [Nanoarchaeota archaeon]